PLITPARLRADEGGVWRIDGDERLPVVVLYVRMDEESLLSSAAADGTPLRAGLLAAMAAGTVSVVNAPGNGVADDKAIYAMVPSIIDFYLGEKPLLQQVDTYLGADPDQRAQSLDRLDAMGVKPVHGYGRPGIPGGPGSPPRRLAERRRPLRRHRRA